MDDGLLNKNEAVWLIRNCFYRLWSIVHRLSLYLTTEESPVSSLVPVSYGETAAELESILTESVRFFCIDSSYELYRKRMAGVGTRFAVKTWE